MGRYDDEQSPVTKSMKIAQKVAETHREEAKKMRRHFGTRPWGEEPLTAPQRLTAFAAVAHDPAFWEQAVNLEGRTLGISDGMAPRQLVEDAREMWRKHQEAAASGQRPAPDNLPQTEEQDDAKRYG